MSFSFSVKVAYFSRNSSNAAFAAAIAASFSRCDSSNAAFAAAIAASFSRCDSSNAAFAAAIAASFSRCDSSNAAIAASLPAIAASFSNLVIAASFSFCCNFALIAASLSARAALVSMIEMADYRCNVGSASVISLSVWSFLGPSTRSSWDGSWLSDFS